MLESARGQRQISSVYTAHDSYDFLLTQWFLHAAGVLSSERVAYLNEAIPGWFDAYGLETHGGHPFECDDPRLRRAFIVYWNVRGFSSELMTFEQIEGFVATQPPES